MPISISTASVDLNLRSETDVSEDIEGIHPCFQIDWSAFNFLPHLEDISVSDQFDSPGDDRETFLALYKRWDQETGMHSLAVRKLAHPAFLEIVAMGSSCLPFIFELLRERKGYWFQALQAITRANPVPKGSNTEQARQSWLAWGKSHGWF